MLNDADASGFKKVYLAMGFTVYVRRRCDDNVICIPVSRLCSSVAAKCNFFSAKSFYLLITMITYLLLYISRMIHIYHLTAIRAFNTISDLHIKLLEKAIFQRHSSNVSEILHMVNFIHQICNNSIMIKVLTLYNMRNPNNRHYIQRPYCLYAKFPFFVNESLANQSGHLILYSVHTFQAPENGISFSI